MLMDVNNNNQSDTLRFKNLMINCSQNSLCKFQLEDNLSKI